MTRSAHSLFVVGSVAAFLCACGDDGGSDDDTTDGGGAGTSEGGSGTGAVGGAGGAGTSCGDEPGKPEMTGPITGLQPSYIAGDPVEISVPVDEDTARVIVGIYEVGSVLYVGGTAEDTSGATSQSLSLFAGVADGEVGEFYIAVELCSTSVCTTPFVRNTYQREDRTLPMLTAGETYIQTREFVGGDDGNPFTCPTSIPIQSFMIE